MRQHKLNAYKDGQQWFAYCEVCSGEGDQLQVDCPGKYVSPFAFPISKIHQNEQERIDRLKETF